MNLYKLLSFLSVVLLLLFSRDVEAKIKFVQILHRHGSRSPMVSHSQDASKGGCGGVACGLLNSQGKDMLIQLGKWARNRYFTDTATAFIPSTQQYDPTKFYSRSTDVHRTLQSADSFLKGLFNNGGIFPAISSVSLDQDTLLRPDALPSFHLPRSAQIDNIKQIFDITVLRQLPVSTLFSIGAELGLPNLCNEQSSITNCALQCQDEAEVQLALGRLTTFPTANTNYKILEGIRFQWNTLFYAYNSSNFDQVQRGSLGQNLAQQMMTDMKTVAAGNQDFLIKHYSAHRMTSMSFTSTLGQNKFMSPVYGEVYVLELHEDSGVWNVQGFHGYPDQVPGNHAYTMTSFPFSGIDQSGKFTATNGGKILLDDLARFVDSTKAQSAMGHTCYVPRSILQSVGCDARGQAPTNDLCVFYRLRCKASSCGAGYYLSSEISCEPTVINNITNYMQSSTTVQPRIITVPGPKEYLPYPMPYQVTRKVTSTDDIVLVALLAIVAMFLLFVLVFVCMTRKMGGEEQKNAAGPGSTSTARPNPRNYDDIGGIEHSPRPGAASQFPHQHLDVSYDVEMGNKL